MGLTGSAEPPLISAVRRDDREAVTALLLADPAAARRHRTAIAAVYRATRDAAEGERSPEGLWEGPLGDHHEPALLAHAVAIGAERAARLTAVPRAVAERDLPVLFPGELDVFVRTWSELYQRSPKSWDRVAAYPAMFGWVREGLVEAPRHDGAVNLLLSHLPWTDDPVRYLQTAPSLLDVTLPRLFDADVGPALGAAAVDATLPPDEPRRIDRTVAALVSEGLWQREMVRDGVERAIRARQSRFQRAWLEALGSVLDRS